MSKRHEHPGIDLKEFSFPGLIFLLRHKELWPKGFEWDFMNCEQCAMGLVHKQWFSKIKSRKFFEWGGEDGPYTIKGLLPVWTRWPFLHGSFDKTPEQVAYQLEQLCERGW
jgi:hypothetical protein